MTGLLGHFYPKAQLESDLARKVSLLPRSVTEIAGAANESRDIVVQQLER
jgi:hypothetical protein